MAKQITRKISIFINGKEVKNNLNEVGGAIGKLKGQLRSLVPGTEAFIKKSQELKKAKKAYADINKEIRGTQSLLSKIKKAAGSVGFPVAGALLFTQALSAGVRWAKEFITESVRIAEEARGVEFAFTRLGEEGETAFNKVKEATRGLLSDLEIKKSLVEFDNFNISLEESATLFEFLSVRATQTGDSVDYLKKSLVEGLSKESKLRIDNLGISTAVLNAELKKTPNFVQAVANIAKTEIARAGNVLDDAASRTQRWNATLENAQLKLGQMVIGSGIISGFQKLGTSILNAVVPMEMVSDNLKNQQSETNLLVNSITSLNEGEDARKRLLVELNSKYPSFLKNLDQEKVTNEDLSKRLSDVNAQYREKIKLAAFGEQIAENTRAGIDLQKEENELIKFINEFGKAQGAVGGSLEDTVSRFKALSEAGLVAKGANTGVQNSYERILEIRQSLIDLDKEDIELKKKQAEIKLPGEENYISSNGTPTKSTTTNSESDADKKERLARNKKTREEEEADFKTYLETKLKLENDAALKSIANEFERNKLKIEQDTAARKLTIEGLKITNTQKEELLTALAEEEKVKKLAIDKEKEKAELVRLQNFEARKQEVQNEIDLLKEETDLEKEVLKAEQDLEKEELKLQQEFERLEITALERAELLALLQENEESVIAAIREKYRKQKEKDDDDAAKKEIADKKKLHATILNESINLVGQQTRLGQALIAVKGVLAAKETLIELGLLKNKIATGSAKSTMAVAEGTAQTAKVGFPQNIPLLIGFAAQAVGIISAIKGAAGAAKNVSTPKFYHGGWTGDSAVRYDTYGKVTGDVHDNEYVVPQILTQDPTYAPAIQFLESARTNTLNEPSSLPEQTANSGGSNTAMVGVLSQLAAVLQSGIVATSLIGDNEIARLGDRKNKLDQTRDNAKIN